MLRRLMLLLFELLLLLIVSIYLLIDGWESDCMAMAFGRARSYGRENEMGREIP